MSSPEVYDTLLVRRGELVEAEAHWLRLQASARIAGLPAVDLAEVIGRVHAVCSEAQARQGLGRVRVVWGESGIADVAWEPIPAEFPPAVVVWSSQARASGTALTSAKVWRQRQNVAAAAEAEAQQADEAILLNDEGRVAEGYRSNVFAVIAGVAWTPPLSEGALPGTVRGWLLEHAPELVRERTLTPADLLGAEEIFLTSAVRLVQPVARLAGQEFTVPGNIAATLLAKLRYRRSTP